MGWGLSPLTWCKGFPSSDKEIYEKFSDFWPSSLTRSRLRNCNEILISYDLGFIFQDGNRTVRINPKWRFRIHFVKMVRETVRFRQLFSAKLFVEYCFVQVLKLLVTVAHAYDNGWNCCRMGTSLSWSAGTENYDRVKNAGEMLGESTRRVALSKVADRCIC